MFGMMSHNLRIYATLLLLLEFVVVAMGVRFVQLFAPVCMFSYFIEQNVVLNFAGFIDDIITATLMFCCFQISLLCVILSILSCFAGGIEKSISPENGQRFKILSIFITDERRII